MAHYVRDVDLDEHGVIRDISPADGMFAGDEEIYFTTGRAALNCIRPAVEASPKKRFRRILDLPCGHGRVMRMLRAAFPKSELTACDVLRDGVDFCTETFGAVGAYSSEDPRDIELDGEFDLIWCGSLLTHLDADRWEGFLDLFESVLAPSGVLVFTTSGRREAFLLAQGAIDLKLPAGSPATLLDDYRRSGFGFREYAGTERYGISLASPAWVIERVLARASWRLVTYHEGGWRNFQDSVSVLKHPLDTVPPGLAGRRP